MSKKTDAAEGNHVLDCSQIDQLDEIDEDSQLALVWCDTHGNFEWHSIHLDNVQHGGYVTRQKVVNW